MEYIIECRDSIGIFYIKSDDGNRLVTTKYMEDAMVFTSKSSYKRFRLMHSQFHPVMVML